uniref:craniofacial development protein 2-like n=1 Tax=Erigeron canadensis TaxID=72917 RepID=UPI001CB93CFE|nr:craniofacial development protein 2-like [Erigeron canadensis]
MVNYVRSCPSDLGAGRHRGVLAKVKRTFRLRFGSWNVGTLTGKFLELADALGRCNVDIACFQETKWTGKSTRKVNGYKLWYSGAPKSINGVGIIERLKDFVVLVERHGDRLMLSGLGAGEKKSFWDSLDELVRSCPVDQRLVLGGDLHGHIGVESDGYASVHGGLGFGVRNDEGRTILDFATAHDLVIVNSFFRKRDSQMITFQSGLNKTQIDYFLVRKGDFRACKDCKVLPREAGFSQHKLLVIDLLLSRRATKTEKAVKPRILWKNLMGEAAERFRSETSSRFTKEIREGSHMEADELWTLLAGGMRETEKEVLGVTRGTG